MDVIKKGAMFLHAHWIRETPGKPVREWPPEECIVTLVAKGTVYYRTLPEGDLWKLSANSFEELAVKEWI